MSEKVFSTFGRNNCGGRCRILVHMENGRIRRITGDPAYPQLSPCVRGLHYHETFLGPDRLLHPLRRTGPRGSGQFAPVSWGEALDLLAEQWVRIRDKWGPASRFVNYGWGVSATLTGLNLAKRLLRLDGGHLDYYGSYSTGCTAYTTPLVYGTAESGSSYDQLLCAGMIVLWGHNPHQTGFDHLMDWLRRAREGGTPIVCIDPRRSETARALDAEWIALRPGTDAALADALAYVLYTEDLYDREFVQERCMGFTRASMPPGADPRGCYFDYLTGAADGIAKSPAWAEAVTGVAAGSIASLARRMAASRPVALMQGYGPQRTIRGEQAVRGGIALACLLGSVGVPGGWAAGAGYCHTCPEVKLPAPENPVRASIPVFRWTDALSRPETLTPSGGLVGAERLETPIKMMLCMGGNTLINQHGDINAAQKLLADESLCEFIVCSDLFLTPSARWADLVLPATSMFEGDNIVSPWTAGNFIGFSRQLIPPLGESRFEFDWLRDLAARLGLEQAFTDGHDDYRDWLRDLYEDCRAAHPAAGMPDYDAFREAGIVCFAPQSVVAFADQRAGRAPFPTPSGKVEIYSPRLAARRDPEIPPIPCYLPPPAPPAGYPLQLVGWHTLARTHSVHANNPVLQQVEPHRVWLNPQDAAARGIADGALVRVESPHGALLVHARLTGDVPPGTAALSQGTWFSPGPDGVDRGGCINVLTSAVSSPLAHGSTQHSIWVEVRSEEPS